MNAGEGRSETPLHVAARWGNVDLMQFLLAKGANPNALSGDKEPVINSAIESGNLAAVKLLIGRQEVTLYDPGFKSTPLAVAALFSADIFTQILDAGKVIWTEQPYILDRALEDAAYTGHEESIDTLLEFHKSLTTGALATALRNAALQSKWQCVRSLLAFAISNNHRDMDCDEVFYLAAVAGDQDDLLDQTWEYYVRHTSQGAITKGVIDAAFYQAVDDEKNVTATKWLRKFRADPNATGRRPPEIDERYFRKSLSADFGDALTAAAYDDNKEMVSLLLRSGANPNAKTGRALQLAARNGSSEVVTMLLSHEADVNYQAPDSPGLSFTERTALHAACVMNQQGVVSQLLTAGADPNDGGGEYTTPLIASTTHADGVIFSQLVRVADLDKGIPGGPLGTTPLNYAAMNLSPHHVQLLLDLSEQASEIDEPDQHGDTALHKAAATGNLPCVELLWKKGANILGETEARGLPIEQAAKNDKKDTVIWLAKKMKEAVQAQIEAQTAYLQDSSDVTKMFSELRASLDDRNQDFMQLRSKADKLEKQVQRKDTDIQKLKGELTAIKSEKSELNQQVRTIEFEKDSLWSQCEDLRAEKERSAKGISDLSSELARLREELEARADSPQASLRHRFKDFSVSRKQSDNPRASTDQSSTFSPQHRNGSTDASSIAPSTLSASESQEQGKPTRPGLDVLARSSKSMSTMMSKFDIRKGSS